MSEDSSRISPTAHYTAYVWYGAGISHRALATPLGRALHMALRPMNLAYEHLGDRPSLDMMLLARHRVLDFLLEREIAAGRVRQVIEVAAGLSPRGYSFAKRHPDLLYIDADLPDMAAIKRERLDRGGLLGDNHRVVELDALADEGATSLVEVARRHLDPSAGTAILTEGLLSYFDRARVEGMWRRFASVLQGFPSGIYLSDLHCAGDMGGMRGGRVFVKLLGWVARGQVHLHFRDETEAATALRAAGFAQATLHAPTAFAEVDIPARERRHVVRIVEARTGH